MGSFAADDGRDGRRTTDDGADELTPPQTWATRSSRTWRRRATMSLSAPSKSRWRTEHSLRGLCNVGSGFFLPSGLVDSFHKMRLVSGSLSCRVFWVTRIGSADFVRRSNISLPPRAASFSWVRPTAALVLQVQATNWTTVLVLVYNSPGNDLLSNFQRIVPGSSKARGHHF